MDTDNEKKTATVRPFAKAVVDRTESIKAEAVKDSSDVGKKDGSAKALVESGISEIKKESKKAGSTIRKASKKAGVKTTEILHSAAGKAAEEKVKVEKMASEKNMEFKKAAEVKAEELKKEAAGKASEVKKSAAKKSEAAKKTVKAKTASAKKAVVSKTSSAKKEIKKTIVKAELKAVKTEIHVQFDGKSYTQDELVKIARDVWQFDLHKKPEDFKSVELYIKTEENTTYYVINGNVTGSFGI